MRGKIFTKRFVIVYATLLTALLFTVCKYPRRGESRNHAPIVEDFVMPPCYSIGTYTNDACVVRSASDFVPDTSSGCVPAPIDFDFNAFSILGVTIRFGCHVKIIRELKFDHPAKRVIYTVRFREVGLCKRLGFAFNLVKVPKIPADYEVMFNTFKE